jgi:putative endonuclease
MLLCNQRTFYIGLTNDVKRRLQEHRNKESFFTKKFSDIEFVYCEKYNNKTDAVKREKQLKGWSRTKKQMLLNKKLGINGIELGEVFDGTI